VHISLSCPVSVGIRHRKSRNLSYLPEATETGVPSSGESGRYLKTRDAAGAVPVDASPVWRRVAFSQMETWFAGRRSSTLCLDGAGG
jgi:hypothetical protein